MIDKLFRGLSKEVAGKGHQNQAGGRVVWKSGGGLQLKSNQQV